MRRRPAGSVETDTVSVAPDAEPEGATAEVPAAVVPVALKDTAVDGILTKIQGDLNKAFGSDASMRLDAQDTLSRVDNWVSTRSIVVDAVLRGGRPVGSSLMPFGRQVEISGPPNSGKTTLCAQIAAEVQSKGGIVVITDTEERVDHVYWRKLGVDISRIIRIQAEGLEDVFDKQYRALQFVQKEAPDRFVLLIWDSLGAVSGVDLVEPDSKESPMTQAQKFGMRQAKVISDGMRLINGIISKTRACYLYTNHEYTAIGTQWGPARETMGGNKPKYFATVRLQLTGCGAIKETDAATGQEQIIGQKIRVKALKNSMAGILKECEAVVMAHRGFVNDYTVWEVGARLGFIVKENKSSWSVWVTPQTHQEVKFQGYNGFVEKVVSHPEFNDLVSNVLAFL